MKLKISMSLILLLSSSLTLGQSQTISWSYEDNKPDDCCNNYPYVDILRMSIAFEEESSNLTITVFTRGDLSYISDIPSASNDIEDISYSVVLDGPSTKLFIELYITESFQEAYYENQYLFHNYLISNNKIQFSLILPQNKIVLLNRDEAGFYHYKAFAKQSLTDNTMVMDSIVGSEVVNEPNEISLETKLLIFTLSTVMGVAFNGLNKCNIRERIQGLIEKYRFGRKSNKF